MSTLMPMGKKGQPASQQEQTKARRPVLLRSGSFKDDQSGDIAIVFALTAFLSFAALGAAVDVGRAMHATQQTKNAMDAAVLAGARYLQVHGTTTGEVANAKAAALRYYNENVGTRLKGVNDPGPTFSVTDNNTVFKGKADATIDTVVLRALSHWNMANESLPVKSDAEATLSAGSNAGVNLEISMMLDTSGSMDGDKLDDLKDAAKDLIDIVIWDDQSEFTSKIALAPFSGDVRLPSTWNTAARGAPPSTKSINTGSHEECTGRGAGRTCETVQDYETWDRTSCVAERHGTNKFTDVAPSAGNYVSTVYEEDGDCNQPSANAVVALSSDRTMLKSKVTNLGLGGGTAGHLGTAWAWYTLSPNWTSVLPGASAPASYAITSNTKKFAILMTDGEYNRQYTTDAVPGTSPNGNSANQAKALCTAMKAAGITVYTVGFDLGGNANAISTLSFCATTAGHFFNATDGEQLKSAFRSIALELSDLRLSK